MTNDTTIGFGATPERLPVSEKERKRFIFNFCGYSGAHPTIREWTRFNQSMNEGLSLGLDTRTLGLLSIIDHALHEVPRFVDVPYVARGQVDSTTAHSKQSMNNAQRVFEEAFLHRKPSPHAQHFQRLCLLGLWMHDYGETVFELTTASLMHGLNQDDRAAIKTAKDAMEREVVLFNFAVAEAEIDSGRQGLLQEKLRSIRAVAIEGSAGLSGKEQVMARIGLIRQGLAAARENMRAEGMALADTPSPTAQALLEVYDALENETVGPDGQRNFLHAFGKTIESVEGQRYLQKNAKEPPHMKLYHVLSQHAHTTPMAFDAMPDREVIENYRRCERRLPALFQPMQPVPSWQGSGACRLNTSEKQLLARACTAFTYHSLARPYMPREGDDVATPARRVDRAPYAPESATLPQRHMRDVELGLYYRAAAQAVREGSYVPQSASLVALEDTPTIALMISITMQTMRTGTTSPLRGR